MPELRAHDYQHIDRFAVAYLAIFDEDPYGYEFPLVAYQAMRNYLTDNGMPTLPLSTFNRLMQRAGCELDRNRRTGKRRFYGVRLKPQYR
jgi:hypothetical protein